MQSDVEQTAVQKKERAPQKYELLAVFAEYELAMDLKKSLAEKLIIRGLDSSPTRVAA